MFDLSNLNDYEFEILCRDIMQKKLGIGLLIFSRGVDEGIDICDSCTPMTALIQVKHYSGSRYSDLKSSLKKEVPKVAKHHPQNYYICTSLPLTRKNKLEIINLFPDYMHDITYVIDQNDINCFLEDDQNVDIVKKNYKLWLCASNVLALINNQDAFIDCAELMLDIEAQTKLFVETQAYRDAVNKLNSDGIIIIVGAPGVGKSTVSKMSLLYYAHKGYTVRYVSNNDISEVKKVLSSNPTEKEIVLLDDFLGQHYLNLKDSLPSELKTLISFVEKNKHKKLILNSRITILNEATQTFLIFRDIMEKHESNKYLLDLDKMPTFEKAKILYNHLYFNSLPKSYLATVKTGQSYFKIIKHKNYNPRIIEFVTKKHNYESVPADKYLGYIIEKLDNPEEVWKDEFRNRLDTNDRILMNTLYSMSDTSIDSTALEKAFNKRVMSRTDQDTSLNQYTDAIARLTNSLLKNIDDKGKQKISTANPSINDYLLAELSLNTNEQITIIDNAIYFEQMLKGIKSEEAKEYFIDKLVNKDLLTLEVLENSAHFYFIKSIVLYNILDMRLSNRVGIALEGAYANLSYSKKDEYGTLINRIISSEEFCNFYELHSIFLSTEKMHSILKPMYFSDVLTMFSILEENYDLSDCDDLLSVFKDLLIEKIMEMIEEELSDELLEIASDALECANDCDVQSYIDETDNYLDDIVWDAVEDLAFEKVEKIIMPINRLLEIEMDDFSLRDLRYYLDIPDAVSTVISDHDPDPSDYYDRTRGQSDDSLIVSLFER